MRARERDPDSRAEIEIARYAVGKTLRALGRPGEAAPLLEQAVAWDESAVTWILDGREHHRLTPADVPGPWPFDHPFYLLVNLAIGGDWPGNDGDPDLPAVLLVDWIRARR